MTTNLILLRHGQTDWNVEGRYQGQTNNSLNEVGQQQAREAAAALRGTGVERIYTSDLQRALQTAHILADLLHVPLTCDARLREIHQGRWQGMLYSDIEREYAYELQQFRQHPLHCSPPEGETLADVADRFFEALNHIADAHPNGSVAVVTHKLPIALVRCYADSLPLSQVWEMLPTNAAHQQVLWPLEIL